MKVNEQTRSRGRKETAEEPTGMFGHLSFANHVDFHRLSQVHKVKVKKLDEFQVQFYCLSRFWPFYNLN